jgi:hypothetical protein
MKLFKRKSSWQTVDNPPSSNVFVFGLTKDGDIEPNYFYNDELQSWFCSRAQGWHKKVKEGDITHWIYNPNTPK